MRLRREEREMENKHSNEQPIRLFPFNCTFLNFDLPL